MSNQVESKPSSLLEQMRARKAEVGKQPPRQGKEQVKDRCPYSFFTPHPDESVHEEAMAEVRGTWTMEYIRPLSEDEKSLPMFSKYNYELGLFSIQASGSEDFTLDDGRVIQHPIFNVRDEQLLTPLRQGEKEGKGGVKPYLGDLPGRFVNYYPPDPNDTQASPLFAGRVYITPKSSARDRAQRAAAQQDQVPSPKPEPQAGVHQEEEIPL